MNFPRRLRHYFVAAIAVLVGLVLSAFPAEAETPAPPFSSPNYASFVCWKYSRLPELRAWKETERVIAATLAEGFPALRVGERQENGTSAQLEDFLGRLPDRADQMTIVYLAAHQSASGQWNFPDGTERNWGGITAHLSKLENPVRLVLLDCCYAEAANRWPAWSNKLAPASIFASNADQLTPDLFVFRRRPVDWAVLFPKASPWLRQHHFDDLDQRLSFFGLVWLESWLNRPIPPRDLYDWSQFARAMATQAQRAGEQVRPGATSEISALFPPPGPLPAPH